MTDIAMPRLSDSMEEGTILKWLKATGDTVAAGDDLVEIETDKANMTHESPGDGVLTILAPEGDTIAVGEPIASLGETVAAGAHEAPPGPIGATAPESNGAAVEPVAIAATPGPMPPKGADQHRATPLARRLASIHRVDLGALAGTGVGGRITRSDVATKAGTDLAPVVPAPPAPAPASAPAPATATAEHAPPPVRARVDSAKGEPEVGQLSRLQQVIARRMVEAKTSVPHFQVQTDVRMDDAITARAQLKTLGGDVVPSVNDLVVKAAALALGDWPRANGAYVDGTFELYPNINVGIAVAAQDALVVPTVTDADARSLGSIARESRRLAERVRDRTITPAELSGATFTVSNLGMYGMTAITPVVNMPQAAILGVGASRPVLARVDGEIVERQLMTLTLSCDHRILYGADAAQFLAAIRTLLEQPARLLY